MSNEDNKISECGKTVARHACCPEGAHQSHPCTCPRFWSLPAEPGPEVTHLRDASGELWHRVEHGWAPADQRWSQIGTRWSQLLYLVGPLVAASPLSEEKGDSGE